MAELDLRCHSCSHALGVRTRQPVRFWGVFRVPENGQKIEPDTGEYISRRCRSCGFVTVFRVLDRLVEVS